MIEAHGQRYHVEQWANLTQLKVARHEIRGMPDHEFDRYASPFEAKLTLRDKSARGFDAWSELMGELESNDWLEYVSGLFGVELVADRWRHYAGVFRYLPDDHLGVHVDAAIHPISGLRKHVTLVLYFGAGGGDLELWRGASCGYGDYHNHATDWKHSEERGQWEPQLNEVIDSIAPTLGRIVMFECNDYAWHGTARNDQDEDRLVMTVSYLSAGIDAFANKRKRAFFVPRPSEEWAPETYALRDLRADPERYAEAYRHG